MTRHSITTADASTQAEALVDCEQFIRDIMKYPEYEERGTFVHLSVSYQDVAEEIASYRALVTGIDHYVCRDAGRWHVTTQQPARVVYSVHLAP